MTSGRVYAGVYAAGVYQSTDGAASWSPATDGLAGSVSALVIDPSATGTIYAATYGRGIFKTSSAGH